MYECVSEVLLHLESLSGVFSFSHFLFKKHLLPTLIYLVVNAGQNNVHFRQFIDCTLKYLLLLLNLNINGFLCVQKTYFLQKLNVSPISEYFENVFLFRILYIYA